MDGVLITLGIIVAILLGAILLFKIVKKVLPFLITFIVLLCISLGLLNYYGITIKDLWGYKEISSLVDMVDGNIDYNNKENKLLLEGNGFEMSVQKFEDGTEIKGESLLIDEKATETLLGLFSTTADVFGNENLEDINLKEMDGGKIIGDVSINFIEEFQKKETYDKYLKSMSESGNVLESGKIKIYIDGEKLRLEKNK